MCDCEEPRRVLAGWPCPDYWVVSGRSGYLFVRKHCLSFLISFWKHFRLWADLSRNRGTHPNMATVSFWSSFAAQKGTPSTKTFPLTIGRHAFFTSASSSCRICTASGSPAKREAGRSDLDRDTRYPQTTETQMEKTHDDNRY